MPGTERDTLLLTLRLTCEDAPPGERDGRAMEFGAQDKAGTVHPGTAEDDRAISFLLPVTARLRPSDAAVDFGGVFVHGGPGGRFLYLGYRPVGETSWTRRWKISLAAITLEQVRGAAGGKALLARISAISGSTAPLLGAGWTIGRAEQEHER